jgi:two-component system phosphate regulon sensor histidine kinase PhoR
LKFAHTESRHLHLVKEKVNIHELIEEAVGNLAPLIAEKKTQLNMDLEAGDPYLMADKDYLLIVIINLIDNAIKYSKQPSIVVSTKNESNRILFTVKDNGAGIEKSQLKKIFNKFTRVNNGETYAAKGFGLGLSFVKKIVDAHGGEVKVHSVPAKGSDFTVALPVH